MTGPEWRAGSGLVRKSEQLARTGWSEGRRQGARRILEVLVAAELAPICGYHIRAAWFLMTDKDYRHRFEPADPGAAIGEPYLTAEDEARIPAHANRTSFYRALASISFRKTRKRRTPTNPPAGSIYAAPANCL